MTESSSHILQRWAWVGASGIGILLLLLFFALPTGSVPQSAAYDVLGLFMVGASLFGIRLHRPSGWQPWLVLAIGQLAFVVGDIIWTTYAALGEDPFPSPADGAYLLGYPLLAIGLAVAIRRRVSGGDRAGLLDGAILATGAAVAWWVLVLEPIVVGSDPDPLAFAISVAYPMGDLLLIGLAVGLVVTPGARSVSFGLLAVNLGVLLVGDLAFNLQSLDGTYVDGGLLDGAWLVAYIAFAAAALHPTMTVVFDPRPIPVALLGPVRLVLLAGAMLIGPILLLIHRDGAESIDIVVAGATAIVSILVVARLAAVVGQLARDIERRTALEAQLSFQAFHDPLTGLANRRRFIEAVQAAIASATGISVLFIDLDDFKHVNDDMGHDAGDAVLTGVGHRILSAVRPDDLGCRIGGDEFAVLLSRASSVDDGEAIATRLLGAFATAMPIEGRNVRITASIGVAVVRPGEAPAVDEVLRQADVAMYHAKAAGKHRYATFVSTMDSRRSAGQLTARPQRSRASGAAAS